MSATQRSVLYLPMAEPVLRVVPATLPAPGRALQSSELATMLEDSTKQPPRCMVLRIRSRQCMLFIYHVRQKWGIRGARNLAFRKILGRQCPLLGPVVVTVAHNNYTLVDVTHSDVPWILEAVTKYLLMLQAKVTARWSYRRILDPAYTPPPIDLWMDEVPTMVFTTSRSPPV